GARGGRARAHLLLHDEAGVAAPRRRPRDRRAGGPAHPRPVRIPRPAARRRQAGHRVPGPARLHRVPDPVSPPGAEHGDQVGRRGAGGPGIGRWSGVDGTWGFKREYYELSMKLAEPLFRDVQAAAPDRTATDCPLAGLQVVQGTGRRVQHPIEILAEAYALATE